jgi:hypothetical protein
VFAKRTQTGIVRVAIPLAEADKSENFHRIRVRIVNSGSNRSSNHCSDSLHAVTCSCLYIVISMKNLKAISHENCQMSFQV